MKSLDSFHFGASLVFTYQSLKQTHMHTSTFARCFRAIAEGSFVSWLAERLCVWEGMSGANLRPAVAASIPSWSTQGSSRPLQTSSVTLNISSTKLTLNSQQPVKVICVTCLAGFDVDKMLSALLSLIVSELHYWFLNIDREIIMNQQLMDQLHL